MTIRTHRSVNTFWNVEDDPSSTVRFVPPEKPVQQEGAGTHRDAGVTYDGFDETRSYDPLWSQQEMSSTYQLPRVPGSPSCPRAAVGCGMSFAFWQCC